MSNSIYDYLVKNDEIKELFKRAHGEEDNFNELLLAVSKVMEVKEDKKNENEEENIDKIEKKEE